MSGLGKILSPHLNIVTEDLRSRKKGNTALFLGMGIPWRMGYRGISNIGNDIGYFSERLPNGINIIFSDKCFTEKRISQDDFKKFGELHNPEMQKYQQIDVTDISLKDNSIDVVIAIGLVSKQVIWGKTLVTSLIEITRVLKHGGTFYCEMKSDYVSEFKDLLEGPYTKHQFTTALMTIRLEDKQPALFTDILEISNIDHGGGRTLIKMTVKTELD